MLQGFTLFGKNVFFVDLPNLTNGPSKGDEFFGLASYGFFVISSQGWLRFSKERSELTTENTRKHRSHQLTPENNIEQQKNTKTHRFGDTPSLFSSLAEEVGCGADLASHLCESLENSEEGQSDPWEETEALVSHRKTSRTSRIDHPPSFRGNGGSFQMAYMAMQILSGQDGYDDNDMYLMPHMVASMSGLCLRSARFLI